MTQVRNRLARLERRKGGGLHLVVLEPHETPKEAEARLNLPADGPPRVVISAEDARL